MLRAKTTMRMVTFCGPTPQIKKWASAEWSTYHQNNLSTLKCHFAFTPMGAPTFQIIPPTFFWNPFLVTFWLLRSALCNTLVRANLQHNFFFFSRLLALLSPLGAISPQVWDQRANHAGIKDASLQLIGPFACALRPPTCPTSLGNFFHYLTNLG